MGLTADGLLVFRFAVPLLAGVVIVADVLGGRRFFAVLVDVFRSGFEAFVSLTSIALSCEAAFLRLRDDLPSGFMSLGTALLAAMVSWVDCVG